MIKIGKLLMAFMILTFIGQAAHAQTETISTFGKVVSSSIKTGITLTQYNWDKMEEEDVSYQFELRRIVEFENLAGLHEVKVDTDIEIDYFIGEEGERFITKIGIDEADIVKKEPPKEEIPLEDMEKIMTRGVVAKKDVYYLYLSEYDLDALELKENKYLLVLIDIEFVNCTNIKQVRAGEEIEIEYVVKDEGKTKQVTKIIKEAGPEPPPPPKTAPKAPAPKPEPVEVKKLESFGTVLKFNARKNIFMLEEYSWESLDIEKVVYKINPKVTIYTNFSNITEIKVGQELHVEYVLDKWGKRYCKTVTIDKNVD